MAGMKRRVTSALLFGVGFFVGTLILIFAGYAAYYTIGDGATAPNFLPLALPYSEAAGVLGFIGGLLLRRENTKPGG
jgi:hypothetical protein